MHKGLFALLLAGTLMVPQNAFSLEGSVGSASPRPVQTQTVWDRLPLPPIPYIDTMPWLDAGLAWGGPQVEALLRSEPAALPFLTRTASAPQVFSEAQALERSTTR